MFLAQRVLHRAKVLTGHWLHSNAFMAGLIFGGTVTTVVLLVH